MGNDFEFLNYPDTNRNVLVSYSLDGETPLFEVGDPETLLVDPQGRAKILTVTDGNTERLQLKPVSISGRYIGQTAWNSHPSWEDAGCSPEELFEVDLNEEDGGSAEDIFRENDDNKLLSKEDWLIVSASRSHI